LPLAALFAVGLLLFGGGLSPSDVQAEVSISADESLTSGVLFTFEVDADNDVGDVVVTVTGDNSTDLTLTLTECGGCDEDGDDDDGDGDPGVELTINSDDSGFDGGTIEFTLLATCEALDELTITVDQELVEDNDTDSDTVDCIVANVVVISESPDDPDLEIDFDITAPGSNDCEGSFALMDGDSESVTCEADVEYTISEDIPDGATVTIDCSDTGSPSIEIDEDAGTVVFELTDDETIECTFLTELGEEGPGAPDTVTVSAAPNAVNCNSISFVSIVVKDAEGIGVADGTAIAVSTNIGSLNQTSTTTTGGGGGATVIFTSPSNSGGTATVTATSGGKTGSAPITVNCSPATAIPPTVAPQATATPRPATGTVTPPSTGDAGLADSDGGSSWQTLAVALVATGGLLGGLVLVRRRA
jgi:hypothetical protein